MKRCGIKFGREYYNGKTAILKRREDIIKKWEQSGLLNGIEREQMEHMTDLFMNQSSYLIEEPVMYSPTDIPTFNISVDAVSQNPFMNGHIIMRRIP